MKLVTHIRPLSYFKAHASEVVRQLGEEGSAMVTTLNGEAKARGAGHPQLRANTTDAGASQDSGARSAADRRGQGRAAR